MEDKAFQKMVMVVVMTWKMVVVRVWWNRWKCGEDGGSIVVLWVMVMVVVVMVLVVIVTVVVWMEGAVRHEL